MTYPKIKILPKSFDPADEMEFDYEDAKEIWKGTHSKPFLSEVILPK